VRRKIYERIVNKGKRKKLALIAVANKQLRLSLSQNQEDQMMKTLSQN
jgi:hypothetical protein